MNNGPVFIGGLDRSGKTYMRLMLSSHPNLAFSKRVNFWRRFYKRFGDLDQDKNLDRCLRELAENKHIKSLEPDFQRLRLDFESGARTYERLFALIHEQYAARQGKPRWGDQTELLERNAGLILGAYPDAKFIHMLRDPRDRYEAVLHKSQRRGGVGAATARWLYSAALAEQNQRAYPQRYKVVRYESMVTHTEKTMCCICEFIGEVYHPAMVAMENVPRFANTKALVENQNPGPLTTAYIGRFRDKLPAHEIVFIQKLSRRYMQSFNYPPEPIHLSLLESARFYTLHWFINSTSMFGWWMQNLVLQ